MALELLHPALIVPPLAFVTTALLVLALFPPRARTLRERLTPYGAPPRGLIGRERELRRPLIERIVLPGFSGAVGALTALAPDRIRRQTAGELERAGYPLSVSTFFVLRAAAMFGLPIVYSLIVLRGVLPVTPLSAVVPVLLFWIGQRIPTMWLRTRIAQRQSAIRRALPGAMDLVTVSMEAGLAFDAALAKVVEKTRGPLREELDRTIREVTFGKLRRDALRDLGQRVGLPDMTTFVTAVIQADQMGTPMGKVMRGLADELRTKRRQRAEEMAMKAPVKMLFPLIFLIFPSMMLVVLGPATIIILGKVFGPMGAAG